MSAENLWFGFFSSLSKQELGKLAQWTDEVSVGEGEALATEGEFAHEFFVIEKGSAAVTQNGERIAELGPGEFFGTRQSGLPEFYIGDLLHDLDLMEETRRAAFALVESDANLARPERLPLKRALERSRLGFELVHVS